MMTHQQQQIKTFPNERKINTSDELCDAEIAACKAERERASGNGNHQSQRQSAAVCFCAETLMPDGTRRALHNKADCLYTAARSALTFSAATLATATGATGDKWVRVFAAEMERLAAPLLRQSSRNGAVTEATSIEVASTPVQGGATDDTASILALFK